MFQIVLYGPKLFWPNRSAKHMILKPIRYPNIQISNLLTIRYHRSSQTIRTKPAVTLITPRNWQANQETQLYHKSSSRDPTRDGWIKEFIKRKWNSGLFWAVGAAEKKNLPTAISMQLFGVVFKKYFSLLTKKLHNIKLSKI